MRWGHGVLELLLARGTGVPGPVLGHQSWTSSPLQVPKLRGLVWTAGTVLPVLPIPVHVQLEARIEILIIYRPLLLLKFPFICSCKRFLSFRVRRLHSALCIPTCVCELKSRRNGWLHSPIQLNSVHSEFNTIERL